MLAMAKVPYEDKRFSFSFGVPGDFSTIKRPERVGRVPSLRGGSASVVDGRLQTNRPPLRQ